MPRKSGKLKTAADALIAISFLCHDEGTTLVDIQRLAETALKAIERDHVRTTMNKATGQMVTTSAAGNYELEQQVSEQWQQAISAIIERDHPDTPPPQWMHTRIEDHAS